PGDRFILRRPAPVDTIGGGTVCDVAPQRGRRVEPGEFALERLEPHALVRDRLARAGDAGREPRGLAAELGLTAAQLERVLRELEAEGAACRGAACWFDGAVWQEVARRALERLRAFHRDEPLRSGMSREELRARAARAMPQEAWRRRLEDLAAAGELRLEGERVALRGHAVALSPAERALAERVEERFRRAGLDPPALAEAVAPGEIDLAGKLAEILVAEGRLVRIQDGRLFHREPLGELRDKLRRWAARSRRIDVGQFKELAGVTRKNAIPLLEQLDAERSTRRAGNEREILLDVALE
ncbi:MAG TPA: SelB C-terminal domain-containing protein, partial [Candidatus Polarisedimenticolaceae bacterium]|nr:SelB C-terminal domain-containing protein [Candidatus Polarisedimenticolaceae bacterium]